MAGSSMHRSATSDDEADFEFAFNSPYFLDRSLKIEIIADQEVVDPPNDVLRVEFVGVCSVILAKKSSFFMESFSKGFHEQESNRQPLTLDISQNKPLTLDISQKEFLILRVRESEEVALMELIRIMHSGKPSSNTSHAFLLDLLKIAHKFDVPSCIHQCVLQAIASPMTTSESALLFINLPSALRMLPGIEAVVNTAKEALGSRYKTIMAVPEDEFLALPIEAIEVIFDRDDLEVPSEETIFILLDFWAAARYRDQDQERQQVFHGRLVPLIRFAHMSCKSLRTLLSHAEFKGPGLGLKLITEALLFKAESTHEQLQLQAADRRFAERSYVITRPVKIVEFKSGLPHYIVYMELTKERLAKLFPQDYTCCTYVLRGQLFSLESHCIMDERINTQCFGLYLWNDGPDLRVACEFEAWSEAAGGFVCEGRATHLFNGGGIAFGLQNMFGVSWATFMADDSPFFVDGILRLRVQLTIENPENLNGRSPTLSGAGSSSS